MEKQIPSLNDTFGLMLLCGQFGPLLTHTSNTVTFGGLCLATG